MVPEQRSIVVREPAAEVASASYPTPYRGASEQSGADTHSANLWQYWRILVHYRWTIIAATLITGTLATIITFRMTPRYEAVSRVAIKSSESDILGFQQKQQVDDSTYEPDRSEVETQVKILESDALATQVISKLGLTPSKTGAKSAVDTRLASGKDKDEDAMLEEFHKSLTVLSLPKTRIVELRYISPDPKMSARILNTLIDAYIEQNIRSRFESTTQASSFLGRQLTELATKVETAQQKLVDYQRQNNIIGLDDKQNITTTRLDQLNRELTEAEGDRIRKESDYRIAQSGDPELIAQLNGGAPSGPAVVLDKLRAQEADLKTQAAQLNTKFGPSFPQVVDVNAQLKQVQANIRSTTESLSGRMKSSYLSALGREQMLRASLEKQKQEANLLNQRSIEFNLLKRDAETSRDLYEGLLKRLKEAEVSAGLQSTNIRVVDQARVPTTPSRPRKALNIALGLALGVVIGLTLTGTMAALDSAVRSGDEIESITGLATLAFIPASASPSKSLAGRKKPKLLAAGKKDELADLGIVTISKPNSVASESYRALRTSILLSSAGKPPKVILVTSPLPQEGKTTTSVNMAITFAQRGGRVLLIDCDLRRPSVHLRLRLDASVGLSTLLSGTSTPDEVIQPVEGCPNLHFVAAGPHSPRPAELLGSMLMVERLEHWKSQYDHIIVDSPPVLSVTDAVVLSTCADMIALVVRSGQTPKAALRRARGLLAQVNAKVAGVVVNAVTTDRGTDYYYGGNYSHYNSYYTEDSV